MDKVVILILLVACAAAFCVGGSASRADEDSAAAAPLPQHWVGTWAAAPQLCERADLPPAPGLADSTLRQVARVSIGGRRIRLRLTNAYGADSLHILSVHVALSVGSGAIDATTDTPLTFGGLIAATIPPGALIVSDPVDFDLRPFADVAISLHVQDASPTITGHPGSRATTYIATGDEVSAPSMPPETATTEHWYYINAIDALCEDKSGAVVVALGDSITDGRGSTTDANNRWPDNLARRLLTNKRTAGIGVLNEGIGGNRMLNDGLGPSVLARFDRDVLAQPGVKWVILFEGINDLGTDSAGSSQLIAGYRQVITRAHACGLRVYGATITPCGNSAYFGINLEWAREKINNWIRTSGEFDGVIDFDKVVRDPSDQHKLLGAYDSGDHLHLSPAGYVALADSIDLGLFESSEK